MVLYKWKQIMFKPHIGICICHGEKNLIVVRKGYCRRGNEDIKKEKKQAKNGGKDKVVKKTVPMSDLRKLLKPKKGYKPTGELALFKIIWEERPHICQVTGEYIRRFDVRCFSHILSKGAYVSERLNPDNIWIVLPEIHQEWETGDRSHAKFDRKREKYEELKMEYYAKNKKVF